MSPLLKLVCTLALLAAGVSTSEAHDGRKLIACSPFVYPCDCGLCPQVVDCTKHASAECFCGTAAPGTYPHPQEKNKFWMCSYDAYAKVKYGVEVPCPARLLFDPITKVCTFPQVVTQSQAAATSKAAAAAGGGSGRPPAGTTSAVKHQVAQDKAASKQKAGAVERAAVTAQP